MIHLWVCTNFQHFAVFHQLYHSLPQKVVNLTCDFGIFLPMKNIVNKSIKYFICKTEFSQYSKFMLRVSLEDTTALQF